MCKLMHALTEEQEISSHDLPTACFNLCISVGLCFSNSVDSLLDDPLAVLASSSSDRSGSNIPSFFLLEERLAERAAIEAA